MEKIKLKDSLENNSILIINNLLYSNPAIEIRARK